jgi:hypothetical protein
MTTEIWQLRSASTRRRRAGRRSSPAGLEQAALSRGGELLEVGATAESPAQPEGATVDPGRAGAAPLPAEAAGGNPATMAQHPDNLAPLAPSPETGCQGGTAAIGGGEHDGLDAA